MEKGQIASTVFQTATTLSGAGGGGYLGAKIGAAAGFVISSVMGVPLFMIETIAAVAGAATSTDAGMEVIQNGGHIGMLVGGALGVVLGASTGFTAGDAMCDIYNKLASLGKSHDAADCAHSVDAQEGGAHKPNSAAQTTAPQSRARPTSTR